MAIIVYWRLDGNSNDASGNSLNGTDTSMSYVAQKYIQAASFNGSTSKIELNNSAIDILNGTQNFTYSLWLYINSYLSLNNYQHPVCIQESSNAGIHDKRIIISYNNLGAIPEGVSFEAYDGGDKFAAIPKSSVPAGVWHYITGVYDGSYIKIYKNGVFVTQTACSSTYNFSTPVLMLSQKNGTGNNFGFSGLIDELIIDSTSWGAAKIKNKFASYKGFF